MNGSPRRVRVLHVNDAAFTAERLLAVAARHGESWAFLPRAVAEPDWSGATGRARFVVRGAAWSASFVRRARLSEIVHVHSGAMLKHLRHIPRPYVLHLHGTDIRTLQYDPAWRSAILRGVAGAAAVLYSTPDLAEHILPLRSDAEYFPVPVALDALPERPSAPERRVVFASRWEDVKGLESQLAIARRLVAEVPAGVRVEGLDWGPGAASARAAGVDLVERMPHERFLEYLAGSAVVVGQSAGILSSSELEPIAMGVPVAVPLHPGYYPDAPPVAGGVSAWNDPEAVAAATLRLLADEHADADARTAGPAWIDRTHSSERGYEQLVRLYARITESR